MHSRPPSTQISESRTNSVLAVEPPKFATRCLQHRVERKKRHYAAFFNIGIYLIVVLSLADVLVTEILKKEDEDDEIAFKDFRVWWTVDLIIFLIKAGLHMYSIFLIWKATRIMQRIALKRGNPESTKDIFYITMVGVLCFLAFVTEFFGFLIVQILRAAETITYLDKVAARSLVAGGTTLILFAAYTILINIFWQYVINMN